MTARVLMALVLAASGGGATAPPSPPAERRSDRPEVSSLGWIQTHEQGTPFAGPLGVFFDRAAGELLVADTRNGMIAIFDPDGMPKFAFGPEAGLVEPRKVMADPRGRIYVIDSSRPAVQVFSYRGRPLGEFPFRDAAGEADVQPVAMTCSGDGLLLFLDHRGGRALAYDLDWTFVRSFGHPGKGPGALAAPAGIAVGPGGELFVTDHASEPVQVFSAEGRFLRSWGKHDVGDSNFSSPGGVAVDPAGRVYVADPLRQDVKVFREDGTFLLHFGGFGAGRGQLAYPMDVAAGRDGRVYVCEKVGGRVQVFRIDGPQAAPDRQADR